MFQVRSRKRVDGLSLKRAIPDRSLPALVAAMTFLAAIAIAGATAAQILSDRWASGAGAIVTVQVPDPDTSSGAATTRAGAVVQALATIPHVMSTHRLDKTELNKLLAPWLGQDGSFAIPLPAIIELKLDADNELPVTFASDLQIKLDQAAPGTLVEQNSVWSRRLEALASSLQGCAALALIVVAGVSATVIGMAARSGLQLRRKAIEIVHGMGASDGYIASRFARRTAFLAFMGGLVGALVSLPLLGALAHLAAPFAAAPVNAFAADQPSTWTDLLLTLPPTLLYLIASLPISASVIGWLTTQASVRLWLRNLP